MFLSVVKSVSVKPSPQFFSGFLMLGGLDLATFLMLFKKCCIALVSLTCTGRNFLLECDSLAQEDTQRGREDSPFALEEPKRITFYGHS